MFAWILWLCTCSNPCPVHCAIRPDIDSIQRSYRDLPITSLPPPPSPPHFLLIFSSLPSHFLLTSSSIFPQFLLTFRLSRISSVDWCFTRTPAGCLLLASLLAAGLPLVAGPWSPGFQARRGLWPRPLHRYHMLHWSSITAGGQSLTAVVLKICSSKGLLEHHSHLLCLVLWCRIFLICSNSL